METFGIIQKQFVICSDVQYISNCNCITIMILGSRINNLIAQSWNWFCVD